MKKLMDYPPVSHLLPGKWKWSEEISVLPTGLLQGVIVHGGGHQGSEEQAQTARHALHTCKPAAWRPHHHREPQVVVTQVPLGAREKQVLEFRQFLFAGNRNNFLNLNIRSL